LECEEKAFREFFDSVKAHSDGFRKKIFIAPCFSSCVNVYNFIASWGGKAAGFLDNNLDSWTSKLVIRNGFSVSKIADFRQNGDALILLFGFYADSIALQLDAMGLAQNKDYIMTGLVG
jgi:hypothetical protein